MQVSTELTTRLIAEAHMRFGKNHSTPEVAALTLEEMKELTGKYGTTILLEAFRRTGNVVTKNRAIAHNRILKTIYNLAERVQAQDTRRKPVVCPQPRPEPVSAPKVNPYVERLLKHWEETVATDCAWMPLDSWALSMLKQYDYSTIEAAMDNLGRTYADTEAQEALDMILWKCEQLALVNQ